MAKEKQISINIIPLATKNISNIPNYQTVGSSGIDLSASPDISDKGMIINQVLEKLFQLGLQSSFQRTWKLKLDQDLV